MKSSNRPKPFRAYVPLLLNGKIVQWYFENGEQTITMDVPMRKYEEGSKTEWMAKHVRIPFERRSRTHQPYKHSGNASEDFAVELYYTCDNNKVTFEEGAIPVIT